MVPVVPSAPRVGPLRGRRPHRHRVGVPLLLAVAVACTDDGASPVPRPTTPATTSAVRPIGHIAYVSDISLGEVFVVPADGSAPARRLTRDTTQDDSPTLSPDGRTVAYVSFSDGEPEIHLVGRDGRGRQQLTANGQADHSPVFSPDGGSIVFVSERGGDAEIFVMDVDGRRQRALTRNRDIDHAPAFSADGHRIVFASKRDQDPVANDEVYVMDADGSRQRRLTRHHADSHEAVLSPRGGLLAFVSWRSGREALYVTDLTGGAEPRLLGQGDERSVAGPVFSPDGSRIVYAAQVRGDWDLFSVHVDGSERARLTDVPGAESSPVFSPDGRHIAFISRRAGEGDVWVMRADGTELRRLTSHPGSESDPAWGSE